MNSQVESTQEVLHNLQQRVKELGQQLRTQDNLLRKQGMNMPAGVLDRIRTLRTRHDRLSNNVVGGGIELRQLRALSENAALINSSLDTSSVLNQVMDTVIQLTGAERGYIMLKNKNTGEMEFRVARGIDQEELGQESLVVSTTVINEVAESGQPLVTMNARDDPRFAGGQSIATHGLRSIMAAPMIGRGELMGVVYCDNRVMQGLFGETELNLLTAVAHQAAVAVENARLYQEARARLAEINELRDFMDNIFNSIASGVVTLDNEGITNNWNSVAAQVVGIEVDQALGRSLYEVLPDMGVEFDDAINRVLDEGAQELIGTEPVLPGRGKRAWQMIMSPLRNTQGGTDGVAIVFDDLTEIKQREAQMAEVRRYLPEALLKNVRSVEDLDTAGQEREISAIFADVRGFTAFSENLEPEELMSVINQYLAVASDAINLYEGVVDKYAGDAVTGLFNSQLNPQPEDHAVRAVQAAMSILLDLYGLHEILEADQQLYFGIGIHSGTAVLGNVGSSDRKEFNAIGDATDMSKVLQGNAGPGEVIISQATYDLIEDYFICEAREPEDEKTREFFSVIYKVNSRKPGTTGRLLSLGV